jgi:hypothetical protein
MLRKLSYVLLEITFITSIVVVGVYHPFKSMPWWLLVFLPFATMRMAATISENEVMAWLREPFTVTEPDSCGAGDSVNPKGDGWKRVIGGLLACPICTGTWSAMLLVALYALVHGIGTIVILALGGAGGSEILIGLREFLFWNGRLARVRDGAIESNQKASLAVELFEDVDLHK